MDQETLTVISIVLAVVLGGLAVYFYFRPREPKTSLGYRITQDRPLLQRNPLEVDHLVLMSHETPIEDPWVWGAEIVNTGRRPIRPSDFGAPITFVFDDAGPFLQVQSVGESELWFSQPATAGSEFSLGFAAQVINPGDRIEIAALTEGRQEWTRVDCRVAGVGELTQLRPRLTEYMDGVQALAVMRRDSLRFAMTFSALSVLTLLLIWVLILTGVLPNVS